MVLEHFIPINPIFIPINPIFYAINPIFYATIAFIPTESNVKFQDYIPVLVHNVQEYLHIPLQMQMLIV